MRNKLSAFLLAIAVTVTTYAAAVWVGAQYLETFVNGIKFGNSTILKVDNGVPEFEDASGNSRRLDDSDKNIFSQEDFEGASVSFTCGTNLTAADETTDNISGDTSKSFTQGATPPTVGAECVGPSFTLDKKQIGTLTGVTFVATSDHNDDEIDFVVYDEDDEEMVRIPIKKSTTSKPYFGRFETLSTATSLRYELEVQTQNANAVVIIDDVEFKTNPLAKTEIYASSDVVDFTPTGTWTGANVNYSGKYWRDGKFAIIKYALTLTGAPTGGNLGFDMPSGLVMDTRAFADSNELFDADGTAWLTNTGVADYTGSVRLQGNIGEIRPYEGNNVITTTSPFTWGSGDEVVLTARVPIAGWSDTKNGVVVKGKISSDISSTNDFKFYYDQSAGTVVDQFNNSYPVLVSGGSSETKTIDISFLALSNRMLCAGGPSNFQTVQYAPSSTSTTVIVNQFIPNTGIGTDDDFTINCTRFNSDYVKESDRVVVFEGGLYPERIEEVSDATTSTVSVDTPVDISNTSLTLTAGNWEICYKADVFLTYASGSSIGALCNVMLRDGANNRVANSQSSFYKVLSSSDDQVQNTLSNCSRVSIDSEGTYKLSLRSNLASSSSFCSTYSNDSTGGLGGEDGSTKIWATRVQ